MSTVYMELVETQYELHEETSAGEEAKKRKLTHAGGGFYKNDAGMVVAKSVEGGRRLANLPAQQQFKAGEPPPKVEPEPKSTTRPTTPQKPQAAPIVRRPLSPPPAKHLPASPAPRVSPTYAAAAQRDTTILGKIQANLDKAPTPTTKRVQKKLVTLWDQYLKATDRKDKANILRKMAEENLIEGSNLKKKIYINDSVSGLPYKVLTGDKGTPITKEMNSIIEEYDIPLVPRASGIQGASRRLLGVHNEVGMAFYLDPSPINKKKYAQARKQMRGFKNDEKLLDLQNKQSAAAIKKSLPLNAKIVKAVEVGTTGTRQQVKDDPTDLVVTYKLDGKLHEAKYSAKTYDNPKNITMLNSGTTHAGQEYFGDASLDKLMSMIKQKYNWKGVPDQEKSAALKRKARSLYTKKLYSILKKKTSSPKGQLELRKLWGKVHGCDKNVKMIVTHKRTGTSDVLPEGYYCSKKHMPKGRFSVSLEGERLLIKIGGQDSPHFLDLQLKTESGGDTKLMFRHRVL